MLSLLRAKCAQTQREAMLPRPGDILRQHARYAAHGNIPLAQPAPHAHGHGQDQLAQGIQALHIAGRILLGIAQRLCLPQRGGIIQAARLHRIQHIVCGAVQDAAHAQDMIALPRGGQIAQIRNAAAAGRAKQKAHTPAARQGLQLAPIGADQQLIGRYKMATAFQALHGKFIGGMQPAHGFNNQRNAVVPQNILYMVCHFRARVHALQNARDFHIRQTLGQLPDPAAHRAHAKQADFHQSIPRTNFLESLR